MEQLWSRPGIRFVVVGEMHGTVETPAIFRDLVCSAFELKRPILAGVELGEQHDVDVFMRSGGGDTDVHRLLKGWRQADDK